MKAVITGATGSVGVGLINELADNGYEVLALIREDSKRNGNIPVRDNVKTAVCSLDELSSFMPEEGNKYDVFFHLAWRGTTGSDRNDMDLQMGNVINTLDAVKIAERLGCHTFVGVGSQAEYGRVNEKLSSDTPCNPDNAYGAAKLSAGYLSRHLAGQFGMKHIWVRLLTVYGPFDGSGFVAPTIKKIHAGEVPAFTKGEQIWDFLYYKDAASAIRLLAEKGKAGKVYVIGNGKERTLLSYIKDMNRALLPDKEFRIGEVPYAKDQVMYLCADNTAVTEDTGWEPVTDLSKGVKETEETMISLGLV